MDFSKIIFNKELRELQYSDIETYFQSSRKESNILEFKSFAPVIEIDSQLTNIYKISCGFLNSDGGLVVWGSPEGKRIQGKNEKEFLGDLKPTAKILEKDLLINKICGNINPLPQGIRVEIIEKSGKYLCIIEVDKNRNGPFQTSNVYYMRLDGQTKPAPHYYIEALFRQITYPELGGYIRFNKLWHKNNKYFLSLQIFILNHSPLQNDEKISWRLLIDHGDFDVSKNNNLQINREEKQLICNNFPEIIHYGDGPYTDVILSFDPYDLLNTSNKVLLFLLFGGRYSPMRESHYTINLSNLYPENINEIVLTKDENILAYEFGKDKGTELEKVNRILGRI